MRHQGFSRVLIVFIVCVFAGQSAASPVPFNQAAAPGQARELVQQIAGGIAAFRDPSTGLAPSHLRHPGYEDLAFTYDKAVDAIVFKAAGQQQNAEKVLDYFAQRLSIPMDELKQNSDANGVYGIIKLFQVFPAKDKTKAIVNAVNLKDASARGSGILDFSVTPGPQSFLIFAFLTVNPQKYYPQAVELGKTLLAMQRADGAIVDGDRAPLRVHCEPHVDAYAAFVMLYEMDSDPRWLSAAQAARQWWLTHAFNAQDGTIQQGVWEKEKQGIFATDVYSWAMAGPLGDLIPTEQLRKLTETMLVNSLVKVSVVLPDARTQTAVLADFSNPQDPRVKLARDGFRPVGSVEWTAGVILALQKNAVRLWQAQDMYTAGVYKALAETLTQQVNLCFYPITFGGARMSFYATGQGIEVAPFGSVNNSTRSGWKTPYYYARTKDGADQFIGGSTISAWTALPLAGVNPFVLNDNYLIRYRQINVEHQHQLAADLVIRDAVGNRHFAELVPVKGPDPALQIIEPREFIKRMWSALNAAYSAKDRQDQAAVRAYYREAIQWAQKVTDDPVWNELAKEENNKKLKEFEGLISYPWGKVIADTNHPLHTAIWKFPILNDMGAAMWGLATAHYELGEIETAKFWLKRIITEIPLHQIAEVKETYRGDRIIIGYWNALQSWELNQGQQSRDRDMQKIYRQSLQELKIKSAMPSTKL